MLPSITRKYKDHSTEAFFRFSFYCDECGSVWTSEKYPYSLRNSPPSGPGEKRARIMLWKAEHDAAYERSNTEAMFHFNRCPQCGKKVCDDCFSEFDSVCRNCSRAENASQRGE